MNETCKKGGKGTEECEALPTMGMGKTNVDMKAIDPKMLDDARTLGVGVAERLCWKRNVCVAWQKLKKGKVFANENKCEKSSQLNTSIRR